MKIFDSKLRTAFALCGVFLCTLALSSCHSKPADKLIDHPQLAAGMKMVDVSFHPQSLNRDVTYRVFLPDPLVAGKKYPTVYLLHGCGGSMRDWSNYSDVAKYSAQGLILVMPNGECSYFVNAESDKNDRYEDFVANDLTGDVENRFPALKDANHRAVIGVSMGGYAAVYLGIYRPNLYAFASGISPAVDVPGRPFSWKHYAQSKRFESIFGDSDSPNRKSHDPFKMIHGLSPKLVHYPYFYITAGEEEAMYPPIKSFWRQASVLGYAGEFHSAHGGHDWNEWNQHVDDCFEQMLKDFR